MFWLDESDLAAAGIPMNSIIRQPVITNKYVDPLLSQNGAVLYDFTGGNAIIDDYSNVAFDWCPSKLDGCHCSLNDIDFVN